MPVQGLLCSRWVQQHPKPTSSLCLPLAKRRLPLLPPQMRSPVSSGAPMRGECDQRLTNPAIGHCCAQPCLPRYNGTCLYQQSLGTLVRSGEYKSLVDQMRFCCPGTMPVLMHCHGKTAFGFYRSQQHLDVAPRFVSILHVRSVMWISHPLMLLSANLDLSAKSCASFDRSIRTLERMGRGRNKQVANSVVEMTSAVRGLNRFMGCPGRSALDQSMRLGCE